MKGLFHNPVAASCRRLPMLPVKRLLSLFAALCALPSTLLADGVTVRVCDASHDVFILPSPGRPEVSAVVSATEAAAGTLIFDIRTDFGAPVCTFSRSYTLQGGDSVRLGFAFDAEPGFYRAVVRTQDCVADAASGNRAHPTVAPSETTQTAFTFGCDPERIVSPTDAQPDFAAFWSRARAELAAVSPRYRLHLDKKRSTASRRIYLVEMRSLGGETIRGYYAEPTAPGKYPAVVTFMGYGSDPWCPDADAAPQRVEFVLSHRGQGLNKPENRYGDWIVSGLESPETYYYRGAYMDAVRAVDFVASRDKVDTRLIFAEGGSQGGALTLAVCALDDRIAAAAPYVPFMSDFPDYLSIAPWPASALLPAADAKGIEREELLRTLSYFDIKNLAPLVRCPILMGFGLQDEVCPPHTNFAGYNLLPVSKRWMVFPRRGHDVHNESAWYVARDEFFRAEMHQICQEPNIN